MEDVMARVFPFVLLLSAAGILRADSLASAQIARALLGPDIWSRVLRVDNGSGTARYPARLHALVFQLEDRLWLYTEYDGTQSLSLYAGRLEHDKSDLGPLLREVMPDMRRFTDVTDLIAPPKPLSRASDAEMLPSGCFVKCIARLRALQRDAAPPEDVGLLAYYVETMSGRIGHCVLVYRQDGHRYVYDPEGEGKVSLVPKVASNEPLALARAIYPTDVSQPLTHARLVALRQPLWDRAAVLVAAVAGPRTAGGAANLSANTSLY
jgi:hypothetical protein